MSTQDMKRAQESVAAHFRALNPRKPNNAYVRKEDLMPNPIPSPRPASDPLYRSRPTLPRRQPLVGPVCPTCVHPSCRERRAERLPRLGGHRSEYASEHAQAAQFQAHHRNLIIYFGEATRSFWIVSSSGLEEVHDIDTLLLTLWTHTDSRAARPWAQNPGRARVPAMA